MDIGNLGNLGSGVAGGLTAAVGLFVREWWQDRKEARLQEGEQKTRDELVGLLRKDLDDRTRSDQEQNKVLSSLASSLNDAVQSLRAQTGKLDFVRDAVIEIKAGMPHNGRGAA